MDASPALKALLEKKALGHVITMNKNGSPQVTLVWMDVHNGKPSFNTNNARQKGRNLVRDNRIMVSVQNPDNPLEYAMIEGTATVTPDDSHEHINSIARKFTGADYANFQPGEERISVDIDVKRVTGRGEWVS